MEMNIILAGVGGQGILTTAQAVCLAALRRGWHVKQSEVHGMSQRGGAVQSHLRLADHSLYSDLIPRGSADMILAVEPLEALRYVEYLKADGIIISNTAPVLNIPNYGGVDEVIGRIARFHNHVLIDANSLASSAGSTRAVNMVMLGAACEFLDLPENELESAIAEMFGAKGPSVVSVNQKAFQRGRAAAHAYRAAVNHGADWQAVRRWLAQHPKVDGESIELTDARFDPPAELNEEQLAAVTSVVDAVAREKRTALLEHEVYAILAAAGAIAPPRHILVRSGQSVTAEVLSRFETERIVLKLVSPEVIHKSDANAVVFVARDQGLVARETDQLIARHQSLGRRVEGVLLVEYVEHGDSGFGGELFVGVRHTREFGSVIAAGLGGVDTEFLAAKLRPGIAVAKAVIAETTPRAFLESFRRTAAYEILSGKVRGHRQIVSDAELLRCFSAFMAIARALASSAHAELRLAEMEVNPFAFRRQAMIPLDGRGRLEPITQPAPPRPAARIRSLIEPASIAIMGVSAKRRNFGRIILENTLRSGFSREHLFIVRKGEPIDGVPCVPRIADLPGQIDLLVMAAGVPDMPSFVQEVIDSGKVGSVILIPGGFGETRQTDDAAQRSRRAIERSHGRSSDGPVFLGGNCIGVRSCPGRFDTFFIQSDKLPPRGPQAPRRLALICQSGAFIVSRLSNLPLLDPSIAVSLGNQIDLTVADLLSVIADRPDIDVIGVYMEGFRDLDGAAFLRATSRAVDTGKVIVFYKAGRTDAGRSATMGHTASIAGDYDVCDAAIAAAGAIVVDTFKEFEQVIELAVFLHQKEVNGRRIGAITNAGFEAVGMADATIGMRYQVTMPALTESTRRTLSGVLEAHRLTSLVNLRNPLDLTPMASDDAYDGCLATFLDAGEFDAAIVSMVPLTPELLTGQDEIASSLSIGNRIVDWARTASKPLIAVVDSGRLFDPLADLLRAGGVPVFRTSDQAIRSFGRYLCHRVERVSAKTESDHDVQASGTRQELHASAT